MWQDYILTVVIYTFVICTIPLVHQVFKKGMILTQKTAMPTAIGNYILAVLWITFPEPMWISFTSSALIATLWLLISIGSYKNAMQ